VTRDLATSSDGAAQQLLPVADHRDRGHEHLVGEDEAHKAHGVAPYPQPEQVEHPTSLEAIQDGIDDQGERQHGQGVGADDPVAAGRRQEKARQPHQRIGDVQRRDEQIDGGEEAQQPAWLLPGSDTGRPSTIPRAQRARWRARWTNLVGAAVKATAEGS
jgi:hypothetical protein